MFKIHKQYFLFFISLFILLTATSNISCANDTTAQNTKALGFLKGNVYTNTYLGFSLKLPDNFEHRIINEPEVSGTLLSLETTQILVSLDREYNPYSHLMLKIFDVKKVQNKDPQEIFFSRIMAPNVDLVHMEMTQVTINGKIFTKLESLSGSYYLIIINNYYLEFNIAYDENDKNKIILEDAINSIKFND